jgi:hypothetical protein
MTVDSITHILFRSASIKINKTQFLLVIKLDIPRVFYPCKYHKEKAQPLPLKHHNGMTSDDLKKTFTHSVVKEMRFAEQEKN